MSGEEAMKNQVRLPHTRALEEILIFSIVVTSPDFTSAASLRQGLFSGVSRAAVSTQVLPGNHGIGTSPRTLDRWPQDPRYFILCRALFQSYSSVRNRIGAVFRSLVWIDDVSRILRGMFAVGIAVVLYLIFAQL